MSLQTGPARPVPTRSLAVEFAVVTVALAAVATWHRVVTGVVAATPLPTSTGLVVDVLVTSGPFVVGVVAFVGVYAAARDVDTRLSLPSASDARPVVLAVTVPVALVALTKLVGVVDGVPYNSLTKTAYAADAPLGPVAVVAGVGLLVGVPVVVAVCQVLVQGSLGRAVDGDAALVLTALATAFVMVDGTGRLTPVPETGTVAGVAAFTLLFGLGHLAHDRLVGARFHRLAYAPAALFVCLVVVAGVARVESVTGGLFALTHLAVFGVAAYAADRTGSLLPAALAYACLSVANTAVVYVFEAGLQHW